MDEGEQQNVYDAACSMLVMGAMPVIVPMEDGLHCVLLASTSAATLSFMINDDEQVRLRIITQAIVAVRESIEA
jgi:hypothetical protein